MAKDTVSRDGCCVPTDSLSGLVRGFVDGWNRDRPPVGGRFTQRGERNTVGPVEALAWLAAESGVSEFTLEKIRQATPENISRGRRSRLTELSIADRIVTALDRPEAFYDGTLPITPNPQATSEARASCCGGSLTGGVLQ